MISSRNENNACEVRSILEKLHKMRIITVNEILDIFHNIQHNNHHHYWNGIIHCLTYTKTAFNFVKYGTTGPTKPLDVICEIPMRIVDMNIFLSTKNQDLNPIVDFRLSYWTNSLSHKLCKPCMCSMLHAPYTVFGFRHFIVFHTFWISDYSLFKINSIRFWTNHVSNARISDFTKQNKCWEPRKGKKKGKKVSSHDKQMFYELIRSIFNWARLVLNRHSVWLFTLRRSFISMWISLQFSSILKCLSFSIRSMEFSSFRKHSSQS